MNRERAKRHFWLYISISQFVSKSIYLSTHMSADLPSSHLIWSRKYTFNCQKKLKKYLGCNLLWKSHGTFFLWCICFWIVRRQTFTAVTTASEKREKDWSWEQEQAIERAKERERERERDEDRKNIMNINWLKYSTCFGCDNIKVEKKNNDEDENITSSIWGSGMMSRVMNIFWLCYHL